MSTIASAFPGTACTAAGMPHATTGLLLRVLVALATLAAVARAQPTTSPTGETQTGRAQTGKAGKHTEVGRAAIEALLAELDRRFGRGDLDGFEALFEPDHRGAVAMFVKHLRRLSGTDATRSSEIVAGPRNIGERTVVRVRHVLRWPGNPDERGIVEDSYLAVRAGDVGGDGKPSAVPTFAIEMPPGFECVKGDKFRCPPCNYEIGGVQGFLCVPLRRDRALALEAASFYLIGTDVVCDVEVQVATQDDQPARDVVVTLANALHKLEPTAKVGVPTAWRPPMHDHEPPPGLDSARLTVELPDDRARAVFHVICFAGLQHVLLLRGGDESLEQHREVLDRLLHSYMLLKQDCAEAQLAADPLRHHTGGVLDGANYRNERYDLVLHGPKGWQAEPRIGGATFRVRWSSPRGSRMWLIGHRVPAGLRSWTTDAADRWLEHHCSKHGLEVAPDGKREGGKRENGKHADASWQPVAADGAFRELTLVANGAEAPMRRLVRVTVYEDLMLIVDGFGTSSEDEAAVRKAAATLTRK